MPSFAQTAPSTWWKRLCQVNQSTNTGVDATTRNLQTGDGASSSINFSDDVLMIQPQNDDTTGTFLVKENGGDNILTVDTTNSKVLAGASQVAVNTLFKEFAVYDLSPVAGTHHLMSTQTGLTSAGATTDLVVSSNGTGTNPSTTVTVTSASSSIVPHYWYLSNNITVDQVQVILACDAASTVNLHLNSYSVVTGSGSTAGDLTSGTVNASSGGAGSLSPITVGPGRISITTLTLDSADINSGKVVLANIENVGGTDDVTAQLIVKYHIR